MIIFGVIYALLGILSIKGIINGALPGHEQQEPIIIILSCITLIISIIAGISSIKENINDTQIIGIIVIIIGMISLIYTQLTQGIFNNFDCITIVLGIGITLLTILAKEDAKISKKKSKKTSTSKKKKKKTK